MYLCPLIPFRCNFPQVNIGLRDSSNGDLRRMISFRWYTCFGDNKLWGLTFKPILFCILFVSFINGPTIKCRTSKLNWIVRKRLLMRLAFKATFIVKVFSMRNSFISCTGKKFSGIRDHESHDFRWDTEIPFSFIVNPQLGVIILPWVFLVNMGYGALPIMIFNELFLNITLNCSRKN